MKRKDLLKHLRKHGCQFVREGGEHSYLGKRFEWPTDGGASPPGNSRLYRTTNLDRKSVV